MYNTKCLSRPFFCIFIWSKISMKTTIKMLTIDVETLKANFRALQ